MTYLSQRLIKLSLILLCGAALLPLSTNSASANCKILAEAYVSIVGTPNEASQGKALRDCLNTTYTFEQASINKNWYGAMEGWSQKSPCRRVGSPRPDWGFWMCADPQKCPEWGRWAPGQPYIMRMQDQHFVYRSGKDGSLQIQPIDKKALDLITDMDEWQSSTGFATGLKYHAIDPNTYKQLVMPK